MSEDPIVTLLRQFAGERRSINDWQPELAEQLNTAISNLNYWVNKKGWQSIAQSIQVAFRLVNRSAIDCTNNNPAINEQQIFLHFLAFLQMFKI